MQVTSKRQGRQGRMPWRALPAMLMFALAGFVGAANATDFDERVKAPRMRNAAELRAQGNTLASKVSRIREAAPAQLITNESLTREQFELTWQAQRAIDEHRQLDELDDLGLVARGDGSYSIDLGEHPVWNILPDLVMTMLTHANWSSLEPELIQRGFRPEDIQILKEYVSEEDTAAAISKAVLPLAIGLSRTVRKYDKLGRAVPDSLVMSFTYQRARVENEKKREWANALLKRLDEQRGRILISAFAELKTSAIWAPENLSAGVADMLARVRQPNFEDLIEAEARGVAP